jgi:hypothetical protein
MRGSALMALLIWLALPVLAGAEEPSAQAEFVCYPASPEEVPEHRMANFSRKPAAPLRFEKCWYQHPEQGAPSVPASIEIGPGMEVALDSVRRNRFRAIHSAQLWRARAFPGSVRRVHGFHGRRGHGRRW